MNNYKDLDKSKNFKYQDKSVRFWQITGIVLSSQKHSETYLSLSGGGGYVSQGSGIVSPSTLHSTIQTIHEFWIKCKDGTEVPVVIGVDIPLMVGQKITLLSCGNVGKNNGWYTALINHSAKLHWYIKDPIELVKPLNLINEYNWAVITFALAFIIHITVCAIILIAGNHIDFGFALIFSGAYLVYGFVSFFAKVIKIGNSLESHIINIVNWTYNNL